MAGLAAKDVIALRYRLVHELGKGGMGTVWKAHDDRLNRDVALKLMAKRLLRDKTAVDRFEREAKAVARLLSPHIVQIYDFGVDPQPFMVMELLQGENVSQRLAREGTLSLGDVAAMMRQSAKGLTTAHEAGIVHRDLKPGNLFIVRDRDEEFVKVVDFGIAKAVRRQVTLTAITTHNQPVGTPQYMSPNQLRAKEDHRDDIWSLAVIAYKALSGVHPFAADSLVTLVQRIMDDPHEPVTQYEPALPAEIDAVFGRAFAKNREERYQSATEFAEAFDAVLTHASATDNVTTKRQLAHSVTSPFELHTPETTGSMPSLDRVSRPVAHAAHDGHSQTGPSQTGPSQTGPSHPGPSQTSTSGSHQRPAALRSGGGLSNTDRELHAARNLAMRGSQPGPPPVIHDQEDSTGEVTLVRPGSLPAAEDMPPTLVDDSIHALGAMGLAGDTQVPGGSGSSWPNVPTLNVPTPTPPPAAGTPWPVAPVNSRTPMAPIVVGIALSAITVAVFVWLLYPGQPPSETAGDLGSRTPAAAPMPDPGGMEEPTTDPATPSATADATASAGSSAAPQPAPVAKPIAPYQPGPKTAARPPPVKPTAPPVAPPPTKKTKKRRKKTGDEAFEGGPF